jgi:hypothetical protein
VSMPALGLCVVFSPGFQVVKHHATGKNANLNMGTSNSSEVRGCFWLPARTCRCGVVGRQPLPRLPPVVRVPLCTRRCVRVMLHFRNRFCWGSGAARAALSWMLVCGCRRSSFGKQGALKPFRQGGAHMRLLLGCLSRWHAKCGGRCPRMTVPPPFQTLPPRPSGNGVRAPPPTTTIFRVIRYHVLQRTPQGHPANVNHSTRGQPIFLCIRKDVSVCCSARRKLPLRWLSRTDVSMLGEARRCVRLYRLPFPNVAPTCMLLLHPLHAAIACAVFVNGGFPSFGAALGGISGQ